MNDNPFSRLDTSLLRSTREERQPPQAAAPITHTGRTNDPSNVQPPERKTGRSSEHPNERSSEQMNERTEERRRVRHSFDVFADQLVALGDLQQAQVKRTGRKPTIGELAQEALDLYLTRANDQTNKRTEERTRTE